tara:strand:+ start:1444 stop:2301 length:858 start_codon:yes stop_codon:yes gene_type:complete
MPMIPIKLMKKYIITAGMLTFLFINFIACGSQMYQMSMDEDTQSMRNSGNPDMNDPSSTLYAIHATEGWTRIPISFRFASNLSESQKIHLFAAMKRWEWATGKILFDYYGEHDKQGDDFTDLYSSLNDNINGHYLDYNWSKTKKPVYVLATTIWNNSRRASQINTADIRFNTQNYIIGDSLEISATDDKEVVDMQSLALHELGHFLGLAHVDESVDNLSIMNPSLYIGEGLTSRTLSREDIQRIQTIYGCSGDACNINKLIKSINFEDSDYFLDLAKKEINKQRN